MALTASRCVLLSGLFKAKSCLSVKVRTLALTTNLRTDGKKLFTPGPLGVSRSTKEAMLRDLGSRETEFVQLVRNLRDKLVLLSRAPPSEFTCVPMQGSGTFAIEAVLSTTIPRHGGKILLLENGAYGRRQVAMFKALGIPYHHESFGERAAVDPGRVAEILQADKSFTHVGTVHCETSTGIFNDIKKVGEVVKKHLPDACYFVDAMSTFGAVPLDMKDYNIDYMVSSANKCIQGVPGFSFAICRIDHLLSCKGNARSLSLDLVDQYEGLEGSGQFRFTPPTHAMLAFWQALSELDAEGQVEGRSKRYQANRECLRSGMKEMGFKEYLPESIAGYIITTYLFPDDPNFDFKRFYTILYEKGQVIYPGKLSEVDCFRLGNIGDLHPEDMKHLVKCIRETCDEIGVKLPVS